MNGQNCCMICQKCELLICRISTVLVIAVLRTKTPGQSYLSANWAHMKFVSRQIGAALPLTVGPRVLSYVGERPLEKTLIQSHQHMR